MALVDHEAVVQDLRDYVRTRTSHGERDLLREIDRLERIHRKDETAIQEALRLHASRTTFLTSQPPTDGVPARDDVMVADPDAAAAAEGAPHESLTSTGSR
jgi:hypothetical protein